MIASGRIYLNSFIFRRASAIALSLAPNSVAYNTLIFSFSIRGSWSMSNHLSINQYER